MLKFSNSARNLVHEETMELNEDVSTMLVDRNLGEVLIDSCVNVCVCLRWHWTNQWKPYDYTCSYLFDVLTFKLMMTLPVQLTATYELKLQQKYLQSKTVYAIRNWKGKK